MYGGLNASQVELYGGSNAQKCMMAAMLFKNIYIDFPKLYFCDVYGLCLFPGKQLKEKSETNATNVTMHNLIVGVGNPDIHPQKIQFRKIYVYIFEEHCCHHTFSDPTYVSSKLCKTVCRLIVFALTEALAAIMHIYRFATKVFGILIQGHNTT